jgi:hypothetical protein
MRGKPHIRTEFAHSGTGRAARALRMATRPGAQEVPVHKCSCFRDASLSMMISYRKGRAVAIRLGSKGEHRPVYLRMQRQRAFTLEILGSSALCGLGIPAVRSRSGQIALAPAIRGESRPAFLAFTCRQPKMTVCGLAPTNHPQVGYPLRAWGARHLFLKRRESWGFPQNDWAPLPSLGFACLP